MSVFLFILDSTGRIFYDMYSSTSTGEQRYFDYNGAFERRYIFGEVLVISFDTPSL